MTTKIVALDESEIETKLTQLPGWKYADNKISKEFTFNDFMDSLNFITKLVPFCEANDHHPDIHLLYSKIIFELQRFDVGGKVTDKDFMVAGEIERLYAQQKKNDPK